jgi:hypothetical protein
MSADSSGPRLWTFVALALPALVFYPLKWLHATTYPSTSWYVADRAGWVFLLAPPCFIVMLFKWTRFRPTAAERIVAIALTAFTGYVSLSSIPFLSTLVPLP